MPKKTKRKKILAQRRRTREHVSIPQSLPDQPEQQVSPVAYRFSPINQKKIESTRLEYLTELTAIKHDLVRTLVLAAVAVTVEIMLYYVYH